MESKTDRAERAAPRIRLMPVDEAAKVRSAATVPDISRAVLELLRNSVDAGAAAIRVDIEPLAPTITVIDDGHGIHPEDLANIGKRHFTSRRKDDPDTFGHRGEALASIATFARLDIESRAPGLQLFRFSPPTLPKPHPSSQLRSKGTIVQLKDIFANLPVRKRAIDTQGLVDKVRKAVEGQVLVLPEVAVIVVDVEKGKKVLELGKATSIASRFRQVYGQLGEPSPIDSNLRGLRVQGIVSLDPVLSRSIQFIYANRIKLDHGPLHEQVEALVASCFGEDQGHPAYLLSLRPFDPLSTPDEEPRLMELLAIHLAKCGLLPSKPTRSLPRPAVPLQEPSPIEPQSLPNATSLLKFKGTLDMDLELQPKKGDKKPNPDAGKVVQTESGAEFFGVWDPVARKEIQIDARTGNTYARLPGSEPTPQQVDRSLIRRPLSTQQPAPWATAKLAKWTNPVYAAPQTSIPSLQSVELTRGVSGESELSIPRSELLNAVFLGQADRKFLICEVAGMLVAFDQHAVSERIRVEKYLLQLPTPEPFAVSLIFSMEQRELTALEKWKPEFAKWGFKITVAEGSKQAVCTTVPKLVSDRFATVDTVKTMVRMHLQYLEEHPPLPLSLDSGALRIAASAPKLLVDAVASRACRSAVMFGDELTRQEALEMIKELSGCELPFQCAHGRPSAVPLASISR